MGKSKLAGYWVLLPQWLFIALFAFPVLPLKVTNFLFILFSVYILFYWLINKPISFFETVKPNLIITLVFIPYLVEFIFNYNNSVMQNELLKKLLFYTAPISISIYFTLFKSVNIRNCFNCFAGSVIVVSIYSIAGLVFRQILFTPSSYDNGAYLLRWNFEHISHLHPTYYSLFACIAILWIIYDFENYTARWKYVLIVSLVILVCVIMLVAAKMPLFILSVGSVLILYKKIKSKRTLISIYALMIIFGTGLIFSVPSLKNRTQEVGNYLSATSSHENTIDQRELILDCNLKVLAFNFWTGTGARNSQLALDYCYNSHGNSIIEKDKYNSHNQFFTLAISYGIVELLLFIITFILLIYYSKGFLFGYIFILATVLIMLTESILERQMGVYFYVLFSLLIINQRKIMGEEVK